MLTVKETAEHYALTSGTIRSRIKSGQLRAHRINRHYRLEWEDVWSCEQGPMPKRLRMDRYRMPMMSKSMLAEKLRVSVRTVERMLADGLPTRNVWGSVRINPDDARDWLVANLKMELSDDWHL